MSTVEEKNLVLNRFMGWEPNQRCRDDFGRVDMPTGWECACGALLEEQWEEHDIPPFNYYTNTPEARERTRLLKDEFVRRTGGEVDVHTRAEYTLEPLFSCWAGVGTKRCSWSPVESHAILDAIYEAIK